jgi:glycosyltransferase involved in cell wall biosynthesis
MRRSEPTPLVETVMGRLPDTLKGVGRDAQTGRAAASDGEPLSVLLDISPAATAPETRTGLARVALSLAHALLVRSDVTLQTSAWGSLYASEYFHSHLGDFAELHPLRSPLPPFAKTLLEAARCGSGTLTRKLAHRGLQVLNRTRNPLRGWQAGKTDIVHSTYSRIPARVRRSGVPFLLTLHDITPLRLEPGIVPADQRGMMRRLVGSIGRQDWVACVSEFTRRDFLALSDHRPDRVVTIHNGVDHDRFRPPHPAVARETLARLGLVDKPFLLTLSSLAPHKNLGMLFRVWPEVKAAVPDASFVVAGGKTTDIDRLRQTCGVPEHGGIVSTGYVSDADFCGLATSTSGFLFPSLYEGFGLPVLEAMAAGAPVIAARTTSLPEVVEDAGMLLDPADGAAWRDALITTLRRGKPSGPNEAALRRAQLFSWDRAAAEYVTLYRRIMNRPLIQNEHAEP